MAGSHSQQVGGLTVPFKTNAHKYLERSCPETLQEVFFFLKEVWKLAAKRFPTEAGKMMQTHASLRLADSGICNVAWATNMAQFLHDDHFNMVEGVQIV